MEKRGLFNPDKQRPVHVLLNTAREDMDAIAKRAREAFAEKQSDKLKSALTEAVGRVVLFISDLKKEEDDKIIKRVTLIEFKDFLRRHDYWKTKYNDLEKKLSFD